ncbi:MAG: hypothetical protein ACHQFW_08395 [Chitinophagales bacterium]
MLKFILVASIFIASICSMHAQTTHAVKSSAVFFGLDFQLGIPIHDFKNYNDDVAVGGGFNLFFQPSVKIPFLIGFDLGFMNNGYKSQDETLTADIVAGGTVIETLYIPLRIETSNSITTGHLDLRVQSPTKFFKPYIDGLIGFNHFSTSTSIYDESEEYYLSEADNPLITTSKQNSDWTFSYGGAAGLMVEMSESFLIDLRIAYTMGGEASYYVEDDIDEWDVVITTVPSDPDDISDDDIAIAAIPKYSKTDMIIGTVGVAFKF